MTEPGFSLGRSIIRLSLICLLCGVAIFPLLRSSSPCTHDGGLHYFRVAAMRHALEEGLFFARWLPDLAFGYGFPFFNYRAPLSYYLGLGLHLTGLPLPLSLNLVYVLSLLGSALGAYLLARDLFGTRAGVVAAVAYAYAPYQLLDALSRGNAPESVGLALLPFILWAFRRLALHDALSLSKEPALSLSKEPALSLSKGGRGWFLLATGLLTALYLGHNISSLLFTPFLLAYLVVLWWVYREQGHWAQTALALGLALGLTAFFWLPALAEKGYVQLYLTGATRGNDFHYNFVGLAEIFAPPAPRDTSLMNPPMEIHLGLVQAVLAGGGVCKWARSKWQGSRGAREQGARDRERKWAIGFFALAAAVMIFMSMRPAVWIWENVPLLPFVQFPWRLIGRTALPIALLAGALFSPRTQHTHEAYNTPYVSRFTFHVLRFTFYAAVIALILAAFPSTYPPAGYCPQVPHPTIEDVHRYEHNSGLVGVDPVGAYFPVWVQKRPKESPLEAQYGASGPVARFDDTALPEGTEVLKAEYGPNRAWLVVTSPEPFRARYLSFYFPGWRVWVDGDRVDVTPSDPEGLLTFDVPAGRHTIRVRFGETPLRRAADAISLLSLALGVVVYWYIERLGDWYSGKPVYQPGGRTSLPTYQPTILLAVLLLAFKLAVVDRMATPFRRPRLQADGTLPGIAHLLDRSYADGLTLIGYDRSASQMPADGALRVDLYWTVTEQPSRRYQSVIHLVGPEGFRWSPRDSYRPTDYHDAPPTTTWTPGRHALDSHEIEPLPGTPPGTYDVVLTIFDRDTLAPLPVLNEQGQPAAPDLTLGQVTLSRPRRPAEPEELSIRNRLDASLGPLTLLGADFDRHEAAPGDPVFITTLWRIDEKPGFLEKPGFCELELLAPDGSTAVEYGFPPVADWYPPSAWQPGDVWRGQHLLHLPANLDTASYTWRLSFPPSPPLSLSQLSVTAPDRTFTAPSVDIDIETRLGDVATLVGASLDPIAQSTNLQPPISNLQSPISITLVWRAEAETDISYRVFLHLIGPHPSTGSGQGGTLIAQSDAVPADWSRPTTGWLPGEYITDVHTLTIPDDAPAGDYVLQAGLYTPEGGRLTTPDGADAISITTMTLESP